MSEVGLFEMMMRNETVIVESASEWKVLVVDDEPEVHAVTRMSLHNLRFCGAGIQLLNAHSGSEARELLARHDDIALLLLDVVMESDDAGLQLVRHVREVMGNDRVRIVLRTGQAGQAPERRVVLEYDINDYKEKTELTSQKLVTCVVSSLRAYQAINEVAQLNRELESKVAERTADLERSRLRLERALQVMEQGERAGRRVQFKMLPKQGLCFGRTRFSHCLLPSEFMSGDFLDYFPLDAQRVLFYIADVSGHGVASAFVTVYLKRFVSATLEAATAGHDCIVSDPALLLALLNHELLRERFGKHIALFVGVLDTSTGELLCANAGAYPYPLLRDAGGARYLEQPSTPVGLLEDAEYHNQRLQLVAPFRLLLVTDGVLEVLPEDNGADRLEHLRNTLPLDADSAEAVAESLGCRSLAQAPDDIALLLLGCENWS